MADGGSGEVARAAAQVAPQRGGLRHREERGDVLEARLTRCARVDVLDQPAARGDADERLHRVQEEQRPQRALQQRLPAPQRPDWRASTKRQQLHGPERVLDHRLVELSQPALLHDKAVRADMPIAIANRAVGTLLSGVIARQRPERPLADEIAPRRDWWGLR